MKKIEILPYSLDLLDVFYSSSRDALARAKHTTITHSAARNSLGQKYAETQGVIETVVASFLAIEAATNYTYFHEVNGRTSESALDKWLKKKWKRGLSISDKLMLLLDQYSSVDLNKFQALRTLFNEFIVFRNRIVHSHPEEYDALVELSDISDEVWIHAVEPQSKETCFANSKLSEKIGEINYKDAARCYEIMLLIIALLDGQFILELKLSMYKNNDDLTATISETPQELIKSLSHRFYPDIDPELFIWKRSDHT